MQPYRDAEAQLQHAINERFGCVPTHVEERTLKHIDACVLQGERRDLLGICAQDWGPLPTGVRALPLYTITPWAPAGG